jgi:hypothetical protein
MKSYDYDAVTWYSEVYCTDCLPEKVKIDDYDVFPIFADSEWDYAPVCCMCGHVHDYVNIIGENT